MADAQPSETQPRRSSVAIARIYPINAAAEQALDRLVASEKVSDYHESFIHANDLSEESEYPDSEEPTVQEHDRGSAWVAPPERDPRLWAGHYRLSFDKLALGGETLSWRAGGGVSKLKNQGVELLIVPPDGLNHRVAPQHALIQFHLKSGVLMLCGLHDAHPIEYFSDNKKRPLTLRANDKHVLTNEVNRFKLGRLDFKLVYENTEEQEHDEYIRARNRVIKALGHPTPHRCLRAFPRYGKPMVDTAILHDSMSSGTFGVVNAAVDSRSGEPLAVKELVLKDKYMAQSLEYTNELRIATSFPHAKGLIQAVNTRCEHGAPRNCGRFPDRIYMTFPLAMGDLSAFTSRKLELRILIGMMRGPLHGLNALHHAGFMHRDVSLKNILVFSIDPPASVLCDYGKAHQEPTSTESRIGPIPTLAPEVDTDNVRTYDNKIDLWGIGYACSRMLFYDYMTKNLNNRVRPNEAWHIAIMAQLTQYARRGHLESSFADLVRKMLAWNPKDRPTALQALEHPCMQEKVEDETSSSSSESQVKVSYTNKAPRLGKPDESSPEGSSGDTEIATPGARPPSFDSSELTGAAWLAYHRGQEQARAQAAQSGKRQASDPSLLRRR